MPAPTKKVLATIASYKSMKAKPKYDAYVSQFFEIQFTSPYILHIMLQLQAEATDSSLVRKF